MDGVKFTHTISEVESINASHNLAPMDLTKTFAAAAEPIAPGTILKLSTGDMAPWVQGTDNVNLIVGVYAGAADLDTTKSTTGLVRVFGPLRRSKLNAWTLSDGSTQAAASDAAVAALEALHIFAL